MNLITPGRGKETLLKPKWYDTEMYKLRGACVRSPAEMITIRSGVNDKQNSASLTETLSHSPYHAPSPAVSSVHPSLQKCSRIC